MAPLLALPLLPLLWSLAADEGVSPQHKALTAGEVVVHTETVKGAAVKRLVAEAYINAPPEAVWAVVVDCGNYKQTMPRIIESKMVKKSETNMTCTVTADFPFPLQDLVSTTNVVLDVRPGVLWERNWTLIEGDYVQNDGSWTLIPLDGGKRTFATYRILAQPKMPVPDFVREAAQEGTIKDLMKSLRRQTEKPAPEKPAP